MTVGFRIGLGEDSHRTAEGGPLMLGGVEIACGAHLVGHSDADVLLHAVTDALLGAAGLPDIGQMFPNTDATNRGRDSGEMLRLAHDRVREAGFGLVNLDCVVSAERPKVAPHKDTIVGRIAELLGVSTACVNVKAKTGEGLGPVGRGECIEARCVALLRELPESGGG